ncbi:GntR family transcriptional regulator [Streptomyces sp. NPDC001205]
MVISGENIDYAASLLRAAQDPAYRTVSDDLRRKIRAGDYQPGDKVPSSRALEKEYGIANMTARSALRVLVDEGLIRTAVGRGNFVADPLPPEAPAEAPTGAAPEKLHSAEYQELSARLDEMDKAIEEMREFFQRLAAITQPPK